MHGHAVLAGEAVEEGGGECELVRGEPLPCGECAPRGECGARDGEEEILGDLAGGLVVARHVVRREPAVDPCVGEQAEDGGAEDDGEAARKGCVLTACGDEGEQGEPLRDDVEDRPEEDRRGECGGGEQEHAGIVPREMGAEGGGDFARLGEGVHAGER